MIGSSQPVASVSISDRQSETAAADRNQDGIEHSSAPIERNHAATDDCRKKRQTQRLALMQHRTPSGSLWLQALRPSGPPVTGRGATWRAATSCVRQEERRDDFMAPRDWTRIP